MRRTVCPRFDLHDPHDPGGSGDYFAWWAYAELKSKTHRQQRCPGCGLWAVWVRKKRRVSASSVDAVARVIGDSTT